MNRSFADSDLGGARGPAFFFSGAQAYRRSAPSTEKGRAPSPDIDGVERGLLRQANRSVPTPSHENNFRDEEQLVLVASTAHKWILRKVHGCETMPATWNTSFWEARFLCRRGGWMICFVRKDTCSKVLKSENSAERR